MRLHTGKVSGGLVAAVLGIFCEGCTEPGEGSSPPPAAETVDSRPGIVQVGDDDGPVLGEAETCSRFREAVVRNRGRLDCDSEATLLQCPVLIRPLASLPCITYSEAGLEACVEAFDNASSCEGVMPGACVLTAVVDILDPACANAGDADASNSTADDIRDGGTFGPDGSSQSNVTDAADDEAGTGDSPDSGASSGLSSDLGETTSADATGAPSDASTITNTSDAAANSGVTSEQTTPAEVSDGATIDTTAPADGG